MEKIEHWKPRGNGPWILLRLEPSKSNEDADLRLAEIVFRPVAGGGIIRSKVTPELWKRYNGYRAMAIFMLLAAAKRTTSINPDDEVSIIATPLRPAWPNTFSELIQKKKFENSDWLKMFFGLSKSQQSQQSQAKQVKDTTVENGLALVARSSGRAGKKVASKSEVERVLGNPEAPKIELFLKASYLNPKNITIIKDVYTDANNQGLTSPKDLRKLAQVLESVEPVWWKTLSDVPARKPANKEIRGVQDKQNVSPEPIQPTSIASHSATRSLAEIFIPLPVESIISHIQTSILPARGQAAVERYLAEILTPECINLIAQKLVAESVECFCGFYHAKLDATDSIKICVADSIAANNSLRERLVTKVAKSGCPNLLSWFQAFSPFCKKHVVTEVGQALLVAMENRAYRKTFGNNFFDDQFKPLKDYFGRFGSREGWQAMARAGGAAIVDSGL
jgi:hypothetical protein